MPEPVHYPAISSHGKFIYAFGGERPLDKFNEVISNIVQAYDVELDE